MVSEIKIENLKDINKPNEPFMVIGKIVPKFDNGIWTFTEQLYEKPYIKYYPNDDENYAEYINSTNKVVYFSYKSGECIGQVRLRKNWNKYAFIEDIAVSQNFRGQGIGSELINKSIEWARQNNLYGLMLETQDNNLLACRFYIKCGFKIGAVDTMLYANFDNNDEKAMFWYLKF